jgi:hypothetical protein
MTRSVLFAFPQTLFRQVLEALPISLFCSGRYVVSKRLGFRGYCNGAKRAEHRSGA